MSTHPPQGGRGGPGGPGGDAGAGAGAGANMGSECDLQPNFENTFALLFTSCGKGIEKVVKNA